MKDTIDKEAAKKKVAKAALDFIEQDMIIGVGTGSTVNYFIEALASIKNKIEGAIASSIATLNKLKALSIPILDLNSVNNVSLYIDGADEINKSKQMIKGGGGAMTREKIIASVAKKFLCIVDMSKTVDLLGEFPVAIEVLPMARSYVARQIVQLGGDPVYREQFVTDNGNQILDIYNLKLFKPDALEEQLKLLVGALENGIFAKRKADIVLQGTADSVIEW